MTYKETKIIVNAQLKYLINERYVTRDRLLQLAGYDWQTDTTDGLTVAYRLRPKDQRIVVDNQTSVLVHPDMIVDVYTAPDQRNYWHTEEDAPGEDDIVITVVGRTGSGKTAIANAIGFMLTGHGFDNVTVKDDDYTDRSLLNNAKALTAVAERGGKVLIREVNLARRPR